MDLDAVSIFVKVVESGSFSGAARALQRPKSTVSAKVAALERRLGVRLIQRTTRKLHVTEAGKRYFHHCANAMREVALGEAALQSSKAKPSGELKVTASTDLGPTLLPRIVHAYVTKFPDVCVQLLITNRTVDLVGEGVDLAIRASRGALQDSSLIARGLLEVGAGLWASPKYLQKIGRLAHPRDLAKAVFVGHPARKSVVLTYGKSSVEVPVAGRVQADSFEVIKALLILGTGIGWLPDFVAKEALEAGALVPVLPQWRQHERGTIHLVHAGGRYALPKVHEFIRTASEMV